MPLVQERKKGIIEDYRVHEKDTGSPEVQVALLTERINHLSAHLKTHRKDFNTRRGLLVLVGHRSALLKYLKKYDRPRYQKLIERLGIRK
ncbi:MAG: 30S ribosomal protein S15 [Planctomycetota bacterium]